MLKQRHQVIPRTLCFIFNEKGQILLIKFSDKKGPMEGFYNPPGGHIEFGEDIIENANREIKEETNLDVQNTKLKGVIHISNFFQKNIMLFVTTSDASGSDEYETHEGVVEWFDPANGGIDEIKMFGDIKIILDKMKTMKGDDIFTAISKFDDNGKLIEFKFSDE